MIDLSRKKVRNEDEDEHEHADEDSGESTYVLELPAESSRTVMGAGCHGAAEVIV